MAGIWERLRTNNVVNPDLIGVHLLESASVLNALGEFTPAQVISGVNSQLKVPLSATELVDLNNIATQLAAQSNNTLKLVYLERIKAATLCAQLNLITEAKFRSILGIV
jgi:hypothetical protein